MPVLPEFTPSTQASTPMFESMYRAQDQRMSMMERSQQQKQREISNAMLEQERALNEQKRMQWDIEAPLRVKKMEADLADAGAKLFTSNLVLDDEKALANEWPALSAMVKEAQGIKKRDDGDLDYEDQISKWANVASNFSRFSSSKRGMQGYEMAVMQMNQAKVLNADQTRERIARIKAKNELGEIIVNGKVMKIDPRTGQTAQEKGAYPDADQSRAIELAKAEGRTAGETGVKSFQSAVDRGSEAQVARAKLRRERQVLDATKGQLGAAFNIELGLRSVGQAMGWGDEKTLSNMQQLKQINMDRQLTEATRLRGQGSITEGERAILAGAVNNASMSYAANVAVMDAFDKIYKRDEDVSRLAISLKEQNPGWTDERINLEIAKWKMNNPLDLTELYSIQSIPSTTSSNSYIASRRAAAQGNK
jgi:hypothetical protein